MKILLVGGGSGGHITPTLAVAESLKTKAPQAELLYVGSNRPADAAQVASSGIPFRAISAGKLRRYFDLENVLDSFRVAVGFFQSVGIVNSFHPNVVFAKGGFVSLPVVWAAKLAGVPVVLHESDSVLGLSNRLTANIAAKIATGFPVDGYPQTFQNKMIYTGLPMSQVMITIPAKKLSDRPLVVVIGGSQGASATNNFVWDVLPEILENYDLVHQVGEGGISEANALRHSLPASRAKSYLPISFDPTLPQYIQAASVVVARAGSSLLELAAWGKAVIAIPLPGAASDHQTANAKFFSEHAAAVVLAQKGLTSEALLSEIQHIVSDQAYSNQLIKNISQLGVAQKTAADKVAELILVEAKK